MRRSLTTLPSWREPVIRGGHDSHFGVYDSRLSAQTGALARGHCPKARSENVVRGEVRSVVTPDDYESASEAELAAEKLIKALLRR